MVDARLVRKLFDNDPQFARFAKNVVGASSPDEFVRKMSPDVSAVHVPGGSKKLVRRSKVSKTLVRKNLAARLAAVAKKPTRPVNGANYFAGGNSVNVTGAARGTRRRGIGSDQTVRIPRNQASSPPPSSQNAVLVPGKSKSNGMPVPKASDRAGTYNVSSPIPRNPSNATPVAVGRRKPSKELVPVKQNLPAPTGGAAPAPRPKKFNPKAGPGGGRRAPAPTGPTYNTGPLLYGGKGVPGMPAPKAAPGGSLPPPNPAARMDAPPRRNTVVMGNDSVTVAGGKKKVKKKPGSSGAGAPAPAGGGAAGGGAPMTRRGFGMAAALGTAGGYGTARGIDSFLNPKEPYAKSVDGYAEFSKVDSEKRQVFGWASITHVDGEPVVDRQGDVVTLEEVEKSAYDYVVKSRVGGSQHKRDGDKPFHAADLIESFVVTEDKAKAMGLGDDVPQGWWVGFKVNDDDTWQKVKDGEVTGFSVHGRGKRQQIDGEFTPSEVVNG